MEPLDGNAIAGALYDVYGAEMTTATGRCTVLRRDRSDRGAARLCQGAGHGRTVPEL